KKKPLTFLGYTQLRFPSSRTEANASRKVSGFKCGFWFFLAMNKRDTAGPAPGRVDTKWLRSLPNPQGRRQLCCLKAEPYRKATQNTVHPAVPLDWQE